MVGDAALDPVRDGDEVLAVALGEMLRAEWAGHGEIDRLAGLARQVFQDRLRELHEELAAVAMCKAQQHRAGGGRKQ